MAAALALLCGIIPVRAESAAAAAIMKSASAAVLLFDGESYRYTDFENTPYTSGSGEAYVPLDAFCGIFGITDDNTRKSYYSYTAAAGERVILCINGSRIVFPVGRSFTYRRGAFEKEYIIYNIEGNIYFPLELFACRTGGASAVSADGYIIYSEDKTLMGELLGEDNRLSQQVRFGTGYNAFQNSQNPTGLYLTSDGEIAEAEDCSSVTRICNMLYYTRDYKLYTAPEDGSEEERQISFTAPYGTPMSINVSNIISADNMLFGISVSGKTENEGKLFRCRADGSDFVYITDYDITNLIYKKNYIGTTEYSVLFFLDCTGDRTMCMYDLNTQDCYKMQIVDADNNNLIRGATRAVVADKGIALVDYTANSLTFLNLPDAVNRSEWIKLWNSADIIKVKGPDLKKTFTSITAVNMDDETGTVYFADNLSESRSVIYAARFPECSVNIVSSVDYYVKRLSILPGGNGSKVLTAEGEKKNTPINIK